MTSTLTYGNYWRITSAVTEDQCGAALSSCPVCLENNFLERPTGVAHNISTNDAAQKVWHKICLSCFMSLPKNSSSRLQVQCPVCRCVAEFYNRKCARALLRHTPRKK